LNVEPGAVVTDVFYLSLNHFLRTHIEPSTEVSKLLSGTNLSLGLNKGKFHPITGHERPDGE
jgi:hypothetical protein